MIQFSKVVLLAFWRRNMYLKKMKQLLHPTQIDPLLTTFWTFLAVFLFLRGLVERGINLYLIRTLFLLEYVTLSETGQQLLLPVRPKRNWTFCTGASFTTVDWGGAIKAASLVVGSSHCRFWFVSYRAGAEQLWTLTLVCFAFLEAIIK
jgi:hypothetical protein